MFLETTASEPHPRRSGSGHRHPVPAAAAFHVPGGLITTDLQGENRLVAAGVCMNRINFAGGVDPTTVVQRVTGKVLIPDSDGAALDPHVDRRVGVTIPAGEALRPAAKCLRGHRSLIKPVKGGVWRRSRGGRGGGGGGCRGDLRRRCGGRRRWRWLGGASRESKQ